MELPEIFTESTLEDLETVNIDLDLLNERFILPIEGRRSFASIDLVNVPTSTEVENGVTITVNRALDVASFDTVEPQESRAHAYLRLIGFPVVSEDLRFFSPGFDPLITSDGRRRNEDIAQRVSQNVRFINTIRETAARTRLNIFKQQGFSAAVFAIALTTPNGTKPFLNMNESLTFQDRDTQEFSIPIRKQFIQNNYQRSDGGAFTTFFDSGSHVLRPFVVDPNIERTVQDSRRIIAAPFLSGDGARRVEATIFAPNPGIEFVLRLRLREASDSEALLETAFILDSFNFADIDQADLREVTAALLNQADITDDDVLETLADASATEILNLNKLVKLLKALVKRLVTAVNRIALLSRKISWSPLSSIFGPEGGTELSNLVVPINNTSILQKRILDLQIRQANAARQTQLSDSLEILSGNFTIGEFENVEDTFDSELADSIEQRNEIQRQISEELRAIELITGEVSGLGLIDIIAIYTALWGVSTEVLLSMLDNRAFDRLYQNVDLRTSDVEDRQSNGAPILPIDETISTFENQVISILSFCDRVFEQNLGSPVEAEGGNIPRV